MRNLQLLCNQTSKLDVKNVKFIQSNVENSSTTYLATDTELLSFDWTNLQTNVIAPLENPIVGFEYLSLNQELCTATEAGEVTVHKTNGINESVTFCEGGLKAMQWSHDQEVVVFVTGANLLVVMNSAYDPIAEMSLLDESFGEETFINVGWGKKETQFHGSEGKEAARRKADEISAEDDVSLKDERVSIVWRGDDEYFAVSFVGKSGRTFKVLDKEGKLKYTSEKFNGLQAPIAWRPSGSWIAVPHVLPNKYTIALFEKNGLRHREIVLPFKSDIEKVEELLWSSDSEVLAVYTVRDSTSNIYLFTIGNYHWYQKQTLNFDVKCDVLLWDNNYSEGKTLHVVQSDQIYSIYRWDRFAAHSTGSSAEDQALVGVIDGTNVLLTNFRNSVIPPPMSAATLNHSAPINYISFIRQPSKPNQSNNFLIVDASNQLSLVECTFECNPDRNTNLLKEAKAVKTFKLSEEPKVPLHHHHWNWLNETQIVFCYNTDNSTTIVLCELDNNQLKISDKKTISGIVGNMIANDKVNSVICHLTSGEFQTIDIVDSKFQEPNHIFDLNCFCEQIDCITTSQNETKVVSLKNQQNLYVDGQEVATDVASFLLTEQFILFTTLDRLKFIRLDADEQEIINERRVERGSLLVVSVPHDSRTVFQMPRGNLEAIQPRVLSLNIIGELLDAHQYRRAFDLLRKQRINLNILVDHDPAEFLSNVDEFVADIDKSQWLNLFLSDLLNEDVTVSMYSSNYQHLKRNALDAVFTGTSSKVDVVCERCCEVFCKDINQKYLLPTITAHVKRKSFEAALNLIWSVRNAEQSTSSATMVSAQEALKYLLYLVNVNDLYDVALGMYDFDLVLFVAQKSQKDPKEYLPFLNELKSFEENYRKYRIDNHLKRYEKALTHIVKCGIEKLEECLELVEKHNLYTHALRMYKKQDECYNDIVLLYADHLRSKGVFYEASLMYERGSDYKQALLSAKHALDWKKCLRLADKCSYSKEESEKLCLSLLPALQENKKHYEAAQLVKHFGHDFDLLIKILCDGRFYQEAIFESRSHTGSVDDTIRKHLAEFASQTIEKLRADHTQFKSYAARLQTVRQQKAMKLENGDAEDDVGECDMFSDTTSMNSSRFTGRSKGSGRSNRTGKNRRKHERKLLSLKEGNPFEDIALVDALYNLTHNSFEQQTQMQTLLKSIIDLELDEIGVELQKTFESLLTDIQKMLDSIWIPEMMVSGEVKFDEIMDYVKVQSEQHYALIKPHQRAKPFLTVINWQYEVLK